VTNTSIKILLREHLNAIDNPHRGSGDFHEKAVKGEFVGTWFFYSEWAVLARPER
jgi:hypothetical protein